MYDLLHGTKLLKHVFLIWVLNSYMYVYVYILCLRLSKYNKQTCLMFLHFSHPKL